MSMIFALMLAAAQPGTAQAPDWQTLGRVGGDRYSLAWDAASVTRGPEVVTVWVRTEAAEAPERSPRAISRMEIRCAAATLRVVETVSYAADGSVISRDTVPQPFESIPPGSHVAIVQQAVC